MSSTESNSWLNPGLTEITEWAQEYHTREDAELRAYGAGALDALGRVNALLLHNAAADSLLQQSVYIAALDATNKGRAEVEALTATLFAVEAERDRLKKLVDDIQNGATWLEYAVANISRGVHPSDLIPNPSLDGTV